MDDLARVQLENKKLRQRCTELDEIEDQLITYKVENKLAMDRITALQNKHNQLQQENQILNEQFQRSIEDNRILNKKVSEIRTDFMEAKNENQVRVQTESDLKQELQERELLISQLKSNTDLANSRVEGEKVIEVKVLQERLKITETDLKQLLHENEELNECLANADKQIEKHILEKEQLQEKLDTKETKTKTNQEPNKNEVQELTQKLYKANALVQKHSKENEELQKKIDEQNVKMDKMVQMNKEELQVLAGKLSENTKTDDEAIKTMILDNKKLRKRYKKNKEELAAAQKCIAELRAKYEPNTNET